MKRTFIFLLIAVLYGHIATAQNINTKQLNTYFDALSNTNTFMGGIAILAGNKVVYKRNLGYADIENSIKADANSKYRIGSVSKTFTATLVLKAVEKGFIKLDETIEKYFPSLKYADQITIEKLLYHQSGIFNFTDAEDYSKWKNEPKTRAEMLAIIGKGGSIFEPGTKTEYSNSNYVLLTFILEDSFNMTYAKAIRKFIAKPLGLKKTAMGSIPNSTHGDCYSYVFYEDWTKMESTDMSVPLGAGAIVTTPSELVIFSNALFNGKLLKKESLNKMKTLKNNFGMGLIPLEINNKKAFGHPGGIDGASALFSYIPELNISYAITSNGSSTDNYGIAAVVVKAIYNELLDEKIKELTEPKLELKIDETQLKAYEGTYASESLPFKLTVSIKNKKLWAQATGQNAMPFEAFAAHKFRFKSAGIVLHFNSQEKTVMVLQNGTEFLFKIENE